MGEDIVTKELKVPADDPEPGPGLLWPTLELFRVTNRERL